MTSGTFIPLARLPIAHLTPYARCPTAPPTPPCLCSTLALGRSRAYVLSYLCIVDTLRRYLRTLKKNVSRKRVVWSP
ncbi:hypothetical protein LshimejAT787_1100970 [Lyophyllum shimeji]|uniref:Uncharacterized protein n=1 Tax=Lyophyllum shimeji TaxID=47721 RepID=A0A9P3PSQ6_LYOSH|nr:hypothetical protein LshimejAT787_1100970 [Lyophyllum shimeji]